jgi:hypothetical protein
VNNLLMLLPLLLAFSGVAQAQSSGAILGMTPRTTSSDAALAGWKLQGSSGIGWPDGRHAIVTFWTVPESQLSVEGHASVVRCIDYFTADMQQTDSICQIPMNNRDGELLKITQDAHEC